MSNTDWPDHVIARYLTVAGTVDPSATVDVQTLSTINGDSYSTRSTCKGCGDSDFYDYMAYSNYCEESDREKASQDTARQWAQAHAENCRAMPKPGGAR